MDLLLGATDLVLHASDSSVDSCLYMEKYLVFLVHGLLVINKASVYKGIVCDSSIFHMYDALREGIVHHFVDALIHDACELL